MDFPPKGSTLMSSASTAVMDSKTSTSIRGPSMSTSVSYFSENTFQKQRSFMDKLFSRQTSSKENRSAQDNSAHLATQEVKGYMNGYPVTECPYIRPLGFKLIARDERYSKSDLQTTEPFVSEIYQIGGLDLENRHSDTVHSPRPPMPLNLRACKSQPAIGVNHEMKRNKLDISRDIRAQREDLAIGASPDPSHFAEWLTYLQSYSEGRFNLNALPNSPPRTPNLKYLPAIYPYNEVQRLDASNGYDFVWSDWDEEKAAALIAAAMKKFNTQYAAISFFDDDSEIFKAGNGYNRLCVPRRQSIAAHVLLSADTFVVLDTIKDWRFVQNPLVTGHPNIRFFAGAPMLAPGGEVVGVFALFDKNPRTSFTHFEKRELAEFGQLAMTDLNLQAQWLSDPDVRSTPIFERSSLINADTRPSRTYSPTLTPTRCSSTEYIDTSLCPKALSYRKVSKLQANGSLYRSSDDQISAQEPTPPSSSGSGAGFFMDLPKGFGKNHKQLLVDSRKNPKSTFHDLITPDSEAFPISSSRPFSSSDITSLFPHPPNTPEACLNGAASSTMPQIELTIENFMSLTDSDCAEPGGPGGPDEVSDAQPTSNENNQDSKEAIGRPSLVTRPTSSVMGLNPAPRFASSARKHESISTAMSSRSSLSYMSGETHMFMAEAAFSCSFTAQAFGYDLVYAAQVEPARLFMTDEELVQPGGVRVKIVVAYGLHKKIQLDAALHLKVLRSSSFQTIEHIPGYRYQEDEYEVGHLFRMSDHDGPVEKCRTGLIFGAFRKPKNKQIQPADPSHERFEVERLMTAASALNTILEKAATRRSRALSTTEPNSPTDHYPAYEAAEL